MAASRIHPLMFYAEQSLPHLRSIVWNSQFSRRRSTRPTLSTIRFRGIGLRELSSGVFGLNLTVSSVGRVPKGIRGTERAGQRSPNRSITPEIKMRKLAIGVAAACLTCAAVMPASAQGLWIGAPGFGVGFGVAPVYAYEPYYGRYLGTPYVGADYAYEPRVAYSTYAYEPDVEYDTYAYGPAYTYGAYAPRAQVYAYERSDGYRYAPRYSRGYAYSPEVRTARGYTYADTRG